MVGTSRPHVVAAADLQKLRDLELATRVTVEGLRHGLHRSPFHGYSAEFSQYRHYRPGDDLKYVDWKAFARSDRLYSRQFRETTNLAALFVVDVSASMDFPHGTTSKFSVAQAITGVLGTLVIDQGDAVGLLSMPDAAARASYLPPRSGTHHLRRFLGEIARQQCRGRGSVAIALSRLAGLLRRRSMVVVLSDFYDEHDALLELRRLARVGHDVVVIQVVATEEISLRAAGMTRFEDLETGATVVTDAASIAAAYRKAFATFLAKLKTDTVRQGIDYLRVLTTDALEPTLRRFLIERQGGVHRFPGAVAGAARP